MPHDLHSIQHARPSPSDAVEVCLKLDSTAKTADIRTAVQMLLESSSAAFINGTPQPQPTAHYHRLYSYSLFARAVRCCVSKGAVDFSSSALLVQHVHSVHVCDIGKAVDVLIVQAIHNHTHPSSLSAPPRCLDTQHTGGSRARGPVSFWQAALHIHVYQLSQVQCPLSLPRRRS